MGLILIASESTIAVVFAASAVGKIRDRARGLAETLLGLVGVPGGLTRTATTVTIVAEIAVAALLSAALIVPATPPQATSAGFGLALVLLVGFSAVLLVALQRGLRVPCGCFGASPTPPSPLHLARNAVLIAIAGVGGLAADSASPALSPNSIAAGTVGLVLAIVVVTLDDLIALVRSSPSTKTRRYQ